MPAAKPSKGEVYQVALDEARRQGRWTDNISTPLASNLPWSELLRKFSKHNPSRSVTAESARVEQLVYVGFQKAAEDSGFGDQTHSGDIGFASFPDAGPLRAQKTALPPFVRPQEQEGLRQAADNLRRSVGQGDAGSEANSAHLVLALSDYALQQPERCLESLRRTNRTLDGSSTGIEGHELTLRVMGHALEGRCCEILGDSSGAESAYRAATSAMTSGAPLLTEKNELLSAWSTDSLYRLALLAGRKGDFALALPAHRTYHTAIRNASGSGSPYTHSAFYRSYLLLLLDANRSHAYTPPPTHVNGTSAGSPWRAEVAQVQQAYERILNRTTSFPRAGLLNQPVLDLVDRSYDTWVHDGRRPDQAQEVIDFHYRAVERSFQSQRILRHLIHLFAAVGNFDDAQRALRLYDQLFSKAKETDAREVAKEVLEFYEKRGEKVEGGKGASEPDFDTDSQYIETIVFGVELLCKQRLRPHWAVDLADKLNDYAHEDETKQYYSDIEYARGLARLTWAELQENPETRGTDQKKAVQHLTRAVNLDQKTLKKRYLLAYAQAETREIQAATVTARAAVDVGSDRPEAWHLLALLTSAGRDWEGALKVVDLALDSGDVDGEEEVGRSGADTGSYATPAVTPGLTPVGDEAQSAIGQGLPPPVNQPNDPSSVAPRGRVGRLPADQLTSGMLQSRLQQPSVDTKAEVDELDADGLEAEIELRITRNALIEILEGPEAALQDQQGLFAIFSEVAPRLAHAYASLTPPQQTAAPHSGLTDVPRHPGTIVSNEGNRAASMAHKRGSVQVAPRSASAAPAANGNSIGSFELIEKEGAGATQTSDYPARAKALLVKLWLLSAATFRRWGKVDEGRSAIEAAEVLDPEAPGVWVQLALYDIALGDTSAAATALGKALALAPGDLAALIELGKLHVLNGELALAEGVLEEAIQGKGWSHPGAWQALGGILAKTHRPDRARKCLEYALSLEESRPVRSLLDALPRVL